MTKSTLAELYMAVLVIAFIGSCIYGYHNPTIASAIL